MIGEWWPSFKELILSLFRFAFPLPKNGQFGEIFNYAIKKIVESGEMHKIQAKWAIPGNK